MSRAAATLSVVFAVLLSACGANVAGDGASGLDGANVAQARNCVACHTTSGARSVGPSWRMLAGREVALERGAVVVADDEYLRRSIRDPQADIVAGFTAVQMPVIDLTDEEVDALVSYLRSLGARNALG